MTSLDDVTYSHEETIAAVYDYYEFLKQMYLDESNVIYPPEGGWPSITAESLQGLEKTDQIISLMRELPYIKGGELRDDQTHYNGTFANWHDIAQSVGRSDLLSQEDLKMMSEGFLSENVPENVLGLNWHMESGIIFLLDTKYGVVYWHQCPTEIERDAAYEQIDDDPYDRADDGEWSQEEAEWRGDSRCWPVKDFFELLKDLFRRLYWVPVRDVGRTQVIEVGYSSLGREVEEMLQDIFREHGWPDDEFNKEECDRAVSSAMHQRFPDDDIWKP